MTAYLSTDAIKTPDGDVLTDVLGGVPEAETVVGAGGGAPAFQNSWGAAAATPLALLGPLRYYKHGGRVYVTGVTKGGTAPSAAFTLPSGYRPAYSAFHETSGWADDLSSSSAALVSVDTSGNVVVASGTGNVFFSLQFRTT